MATTTFEQRKFPGSILLLLFMALVIMFVASVYSKHAVDRHGNDAVMVRKCLQKNGPLETWENKDSGRTAEIVCLDNGLYGIQICEGKFEVTCFIKNRMNKLSQVRNYLGNTGYSPP